METNKGIDYGLGQSNINLETGIRIGVIPSHEVLQAWADDSEAQYVPSCPACGTELANFDPQTCECGEKITEDSFECMEPVSFYYEQDGYLCEQSRDDVDIFVCKSPYYTYAQFCSPCAPGACYLPSPLDNPEADNKCYCFGHDWFDDDKAPYPVYSVETGKQV